MDLRDHGLSCLCFSVVLSPLGLGIVLALVGLEPLAGLAFISAGATGAASAGFDIYDRTQHQDFAWDTRTWLDIGQIVLSGTMIADGAVEAAPLLKGVSGRFALKLTFKQAVQIGGRWIAAGSTIIITGVANESYITTILSIWADPNLTVKQKLQKIWATLQDAKDHGGLQTVAMAMGGVFPLAGDARTAFDSFFKADNVAFSDLLDENGQIKSSLLNADGTFNAEGQALIKKLALGADADPGLVQALATDPGLQSAFKNMHGDTATLKQWYQDYQNKVDAGLIDTSTTSFGKFVSDPRYASDDPNMGAVTDVTGANAFSRYQRYRLQPILDDLHAGTLVKPPSMSQANWNEFLQKLQNDPQMQMALVNALDTGYTLDDLAQFYDTWKSGAGRNGRELPPDQKADFYSYIAQGPHITSDVNAPAATVGDRIPTFDSLTSSRARALALLSDSKPDLVTLYNDLEAAKAAGTLTPAQQKLLNALDDALTQSQGSLNSVYAGTAMSDATGPFYKTFNEVLGRDLAQNGTIQDFQLIMSKIPGGSTNNVVRGSVGEWYYYYLVKDTPAGASLGRQVELFTNDGTKVRADFYSPPPPTGTGRTLDIKTGYSDTAIEADQIQNYGALIAEGKITGNDYLFLPDGGGAGGAKLAATKAYKNIGRAGQLDNMRVYFIDDAGKVEQIVGIDAQGNPITQVMGDASVIITPPAR